MGLTVSEKDHFRSRLKARAEEIRDQIKAEEPKWKRDLTKEAQKLIEEHFDVQEDMETLRKMREARQALGSQIDDMEAKVIEKMRGRQREDLPSMAESRRNSRHYGQADEDEQDFQRYPANARQIMLDHCKRMLRLLIRDHPVGKRLKKLEEQRADFEDRIAACGTHTQLQTIWSEVRAALDIFELDNTVPREARKVDTTRANRIKQTAKADT